MYLRNALKVNFYTVGFGWKTAVVSTTANY